jgi:NAD(P)H-hydrate epimerase
LGTLDFQANLAKLHQTGAEIRFLQGEENFVPIPDEDLVIDALFGSGLNRPLAGVTAQLVDHINASGNKVVSIDIPSGLFVDRSSKGNPVVNASHTLSFQCFKPAFLVAENAGAIGEVHILDIGLHPGFLTELEKIQIPILVDRGMIKEKLKPRSAFSNKGNFGHALLVCGGLGKMGAAILAAKACLRSGAGLVSCHIPACGYSIMQTAFPEAMVFTDKDEKKITGLSTDPEKYSVLGIGPGIGTDPATLKCLRTVLGKCSKPVLLDADALNLISTDETIWELIPPHSVLTPHPKEFQRLFGDSENDFQMIEKAKEQAIKRKCVIVLKGHHTLIATPEALAFFNNTGNAGLAKGGSGDVLSGMIVAFLSQGYSSTDAAVLAVYFHGLAADHLASFTAKESLIATDIINAIGQAIFSVQC